MLIDFSMLAPRNVVRKENLFVFHTLNLDAPTGETVAGRPEARSQSSREAKTVRNTRPATRGWTIARWMTYKRTRSGCAPNFKTKREPVILNRSALFVLLLITSLLAACGGDPEIPDDAEAKDYRSTAEEGSAEEKPADETTEPAEASVVKAVGPVATVNGVDVTAESFNVEVQRVMAAGLPPAALQQLKGQLVDKLIERTLLEQAIEKEGIEVTDDQIEKKFEEVRAEFAKVQAQNPNGPEVSLEQLAKQLGISQKELRDSIAQTIAVEALLKKRGVSEVTDKEVREFYDSNSESFFRPETVTARHILVRVDAGADKTTVEAKRKEAEAIAEAARKKDADFAQLAIDKSEGPSGPNGGQLPAFQRGQMVTEFEEAAFNMKPGTISEPVKTQFGWHIIKVEKKTDEGQVPFEEVSEQLKQKLKNDKLETGIAELVTELRDGSEIVVHEDAIQ